mgnify:CR=1 FL=1|jgi:VanZ family protein
MKNIILSLLFIAILFSVNQFIFIPAHLLYEIVWLDIPLHILGGILFASLYISILKYYKKQVKYINIIFFVMTIGVLWEIYEYYIHIFLGYDWNGILDTVKDLFDDFLGVSIAYLFNKKSF